MKQSIDKTACCRTREKYSQKAEIIKSHCSLGFLVLLFSFIFGSSSAVALEKFYLADVGEPMAALVLPDDPDDLERKAAEEIIEHYRLVTGGSLQIVRSVESARSDHLMPICIGGAADPALDEASLAAKDNPSTFTLRITPDRVDIRGLSPEGTLFGAYELLEQLGFRWYMPGDLGRVVPDRDEIEETLALVPQEITQAPAMNYRRLQHMGGGAWQQRVRMGGEPRSTGSHGIRGDGRDNWGTEGRGQICVSGDYNPGALEGTIAWIRENYESTDEKIYIGMGPRDGSSQAYCLCEGCKELDQGVYDPFFGGESMTDRYIWFFNQVLDELEEEYPNLHIAWYVYQRHMMPPVTEPNPRIVQVFAPISLERQHSMDNPKAMDRQVMRWLIDRWWEHEPNEMYYRGYFNFLACVQLPKTMLDRVRNDIPAMYERGINVMRVEVIRHAWASDPITLYVAARLMWDPHTDVDALLEEFYGKFYGPAEEPMLAYHEKLEAAFRDTPYATGSSYVYFPIFLNSSLRDELRGYLQQARSMVRDGTLYADRIEMLQRGYERKDLFLDMIDARNEFDFETAWEKKESFNELSSRMVGNELERWGSGIRRVHAEVHGRENPERGGAYFNRFFLPTIESGYERAVEVGEVVAALPDEWLFRQDTAGIGEQLMFHRPGELGGVWKPMKTKSMTWGDQGLYHFRGENARGWYRVSVQIPEEYEGRPVYLWFAGVDTRARVWINGEYVGTSQEPKEGLPGVPGSFRTFDMPATNAVRFGEDNWVVVEVTNDRLGELGTGGIMGPVMFWSPHDPDWQP